MNERIIVKRRFEIKLTRSYGHGRVIYSRAAYVFITNQVIFSWILEKINFLAVT